MGELSRTGRCNVDPKVLDNRSGTRAFNPIWQLLLDAWLDCGVEGGHLLAPLPPGSVEVMAWTLFGALTEGD